MTQWKLKGRTVPTLVALGLAMLSLAGCGKPEAASEKGGRGGKGGDQAARAPRAVHLAPVQELKLEKTLSVTGTLAADEQATVSTKVAGRLASISVDLGSPVKRGQEIARIEPTDYQLRVDQAASTLAQARAGLGLPAEGDDEKVDLEQLARVREARATLEEARANLDRSKALVAKELIARADLDTANATFIRAESGLQSAREEVLNRQALARQRRSELMLARQQLTDTAVRSPLEGRVDRRMVNVGEFLAAGTPVAAVVRLSPLRLRTEVPERDAGGVRVGQTVRVSVEGDSGVFTGRVARLSPTISQQYRVLVVEAEIPSPGQLRPGSFARAEIVIDAASPALVVPSSSVVVFAGIEKVLTLEAGKAVEKVIATGRHVGDVIEVLSGLKASDQVVVDPGNLQQGQPLTVIEGPLSRESAARESATEKPATGRPAAGGPVAEAPAAGGPAAGGPASGEPANKGH